MLFRSQLLFLESENPTKDISLYINSPGGIVTSGLAMYDTMQYVRPEISTVCIGQAASMGSLLLCAGEPGMRFALPNARIMVHQPSGGFQGQATDIMLHAQEILNLKKRLNEIYVRHTGQPIKKIEDALERDNFLTSDMAKDFGLIEITRKRVRQSLERTLCQPCPNCAGTGRVKSAATICYAIHRELLKSGRAKVVSHPDESERDFRDRTQQGAREKRDAALEVRQHREPAERAAQFEAIAALLASLMTAEEQRLYPVLDHLGDLIHDLRLDAEEVA